MPTDRRSSELVEIAVFSLDAVTIEFKREVRNSSSSMIEPFEDGLCSDFVGGSISYAYVGSYLPEIDQNRSPTFI